MRHGALSENALLALLARAGYFGRQTAHGFRASFSTWAHEVREADPDFLIIAPCGFGIDRTLRELPLLEALPGWRQLKSVKAGRVALADGNLYFNRSGTTIVETVEIIAEILHGHRGAEKRHAGAWRPYSETTVGVSETGSYRFAPR